MTAAFFVAADWLVERIDDLEIRVLNARMVPLGQEDHDVGEEYHTGHIPGAISFDIEALSDHTSPLPHMMPRPEAFAVAMRELGVNQDRHLIIYDDGNLSSASHVWWMLQTLSVENVSILAGSLASWKRGELMLEESDEDLPEDEFNVAFTPDAVMRATDVLLASYEKAVRIVDARPAARFNGEIDEPRPGLKHGRMPGAPNVSWTELVRGDELKTIDELDAILFNRGASFDRPIIASCGSGVAATAIVLVLATLGVTDVASYDSAWSEWGTRNDLPTEPQL